MADATKQGPHGDLLYDFIQGARTMVKRGEQALGIGGDSTKAPQGGQPASTATTQPSETTDGTENKPTGYVPVGTDKTGKQIDEAERRSGAYAKGGIVNEPPGGASQWKPPANTGGEGAKTHFKGVNAEHQSRPGPGYATGGPVNYQDGGQVSGPGGPTSDSVQANLSNGEFVIPAKYVTYLGQKFFQDLLTKADTEMAQGQQPPNLWADLASDDEPDSAAAGGTNPPPFQAVPPQQPPQ